jgi:Family of unknown function (DUF6350)
MTALFSAPTTPSASGSPFGRTPQSTDPRHRRPLVLVATLGGLTAASTTLIVLCAIGVIGWFVTDAGVHGAPRDGLRVGALTWLAAHGSGVRVQGVAITLLPLGITAVCAWVIWRLGYRVGDSVSGHGPDADDIVNGERDWTVAIATTMFAAAYVVVVALTGVLASTPATAPSMSAALGWAAVLALGVGGTGIAVGSGRAAIWAAATPQLVRVVLAGGRRIVMAYAAVSLVVLLGSLVLNFSTAATIASRLQADNGDTALFLLATLAVVPNAIAFSGAYLLGPGFAVGAKTVVSPSVVVVGPLPLFPLVAALPEQGNGPIWAPWLWVVPVLVSAAAAAHNHRRYPTLSWLDGLVRGGAAGVLAGVAIAVFALLAGGAVGPGRMRHVTPFVFDVLTHGIAYFGIGGLVGGALMTWWCRRFSASEALAADGASAPV